MTFVYIQMLPQKRMNMSTYTTRRPAVISDAIPRMVLSMREAIVSTDLAGSLVSLGTARVFAPRKKKKLLGRKERLLLFLFAIRGLSEEEKPHKNQLLNDTVYAPP